MQWRGETRADLERDVDLAESGELKLWGAASGQLAAPGIRAVALFEEMCRRHPEIGPGVRRTLERRIRAWRAVNGSEQDVIFRQEHPPGRLGLSGFTDMGRLGITMAGQWLYGLLAEDDFSKVG